MVDYFSKYPEIEELRSKTASSVIEALKKSSARHGIPETIVCDNMPFSSHTFNEFAKEWGCKVTTSSPRYPRSNGQAERYVGIIKQIMRKTNAEGKDMYLALLNYRNTPVSSMNVSPAQMLMSRRLRDRLPRSERSLQPQVASNVLENLHKRQQKHADVYNRRARPEKKSFRPGDHIRIRTGRTWERGIITELHSAPRSYMVRMEDGTVLRRNRNMIRHSPDKAIITPPQADHVPVPAAGPRRSNRQRQPPRRMADYVT